MPVIDGVGYSPTTVRKQADFARFLRVHMLMSKGVIRRQAWADDVYYYFDLHAGPGIHKEYGCGSPLIFLKTSAGVDIPHRAVFIEKRKNLCEELEVNTSLWPNANCVVRHGKCEDILPEYFVKPDRKPIGLVYVDPNGALPIELLERASQHPFFNRIDFLLNVSATAYKRMAQSSERILQLLQKIDKKRWLIREPDNHSGWQWTMLFGTQMKGDQLPKLEKIGFHRLVALQGMEILKHLQFTKEEKAAGMRLILHNGNGWGESR